MGVFVFVAVAFLVPAATAGDEIVFGVLEPLSGPFKDVGDRYANAVKFAVEQINKEGGLLGKKVVAAVEDDALKPAIAARKAKKLVLEKGAKFLMTGTGSHITLAMNTVAKKYKVINLTYGTEAAKITGSAFIPYTFRACLNTDQHSAAVVEYIVKKFPQFKKYYIICQDYSFGREAAEGFRKKFDQIKPKGARIVGEIFHPIATKDFAPYISAIMASGAEVVLSGNWGTDLRLLIKHGASMGWKAKLGNYFLNDPLILRDLGKEAMGFVGADSYMITIDSPKNKEFLAKWSEKYKDAPLEYRYPTLSMGRAYWAVRFLAAAIKKGVKVPVTTAGRISTPRRAEAILQDKKADLIGLARMLWVDPDWPKKARAGRDKAILKCSPKCDACFKLVMQGRPAFCTRWEKEKRAEYSGLFE